MIPEIAVAHILVNWNGKTIVGIAIIAILVYGMFLGPKGKARNTKKYDEHDKNKLQDAFKTATGSHTTRGSGMYKDANGKIHYERHEKK